MTRDILIGVDAGTSVIKAVAFDLDGRQIAVESRRNHYRTLPDGGVEQDMRRTWADTVAVIRALAARLPGLADRALAIGVTGQGDGTWLVDAAGAPVHDGWLWLDARAAAEARELDRSPGIEEIYRLTGTGVNLCQMRSQLLWMKRHAPELLDRAATALHCKEWLYLNLTGVRASDPTEAVFTFGDFRTRDYSDVVIAALGLADLRHLLPPVVDGARCAHGLTPPAAAALGLPAGLPVSLGYVDVVCTAIGAGLLDPGAEPGFSVIGSTGMHMRFVPDAASVRLNPDRTGYTMALPGRAYAQMQTNMAATLNIDWALGLAVEMLAAEGVTRRPAELLAGLDARLEAARPGAALYHPYISSAGERGPFTEPMARASFTGLDQNTGWFDMLRAVYDGLALAARDCFAAMGPVPSEIRLSGGAARSGALRRFLAAALNRPVRRVAREEAGAAGAAMIAAVAQGVFADIEDCARAWVTPALQPPEAPDPALVPVYDALYEAYLAGRRAAPPAWAALAGMRKALT
ncbi:MAG: carbohydrate kinase [Alphaproteobacteria bacterium]|nr:MAG: carbohydrate kinase [Alphaproteobacteria bacterium]